VAMLAKNFRKSKETSQRSWTRGWERSQRTPMFWMLRLWAYSGRLLESQEGQGEGLQCESQWRVRRRCSRVWQISGFVAPYIEEEDSYYSEHSENEVELKEAYKTLYKEFEKLREGRKQQVNVLNSLHTEKSSLLLKIQELEEKLLETQLQLERVIDEKLTRMMSI
jgi:hypothetical protein